MSSDFKELCNLLFPNDSSSYEKLSDISDYVKNLGAHNWEHIKQEPQKLEEDMKKLTEQTQELAFANYKTFVGTADISKTTIKDLGKAKESIDTYLQVMPTFIQQCEEFSAVTESIFKEKSRNMGSRNQNDKLLELLELPSLMREALNAEDYESALDIFTFVRNLSKRYSDIAVVQITASEIMTLWFETLYHLFNQLRYDLPLPQCLQILGYLRRANTVYKSTDDDSLQYSALGKKAPISDGLHLHFLKARNAWFENALQEARNTESPEKILRKIVELHRIHLFNVLTQHKSIFLSDVQDSKSKEDELNGNSAMSCWLKLKVEKLAEILNNDLPKEDESSFESLYNQCMYLSLSFGRVGADMRCVLTPLFRDNILQQFHAGMEKTDTQLELHMKSYKVSSIKNILRPLTENTALSPPESLLDYYPLAEYCNGLLTVLNALRVTAPLNIVKDVYSAFRKSLEKAVQLLVMFYHREQQAYSDIERQNYVSMCKCFVEDFLPFIVKCLSLSFPSVQVAELLGVTLTVLQETKLLHVDQITICQPLKCINGLNIV